jgi:membrane protease YdiL (CAAX protease family)
MNPNEFIINPQTGLLRAGWRAAIFIALLYSPYLIYGLLPKNVDTSSAAAPIVAVDVSPGMILTYALLIVWVVAVSWICLRFLERMKLSALGFALRGGWFGDVLKGCAIGGVMIASVVALQVAGAGSRLSFNPILRLERGGINWAGARTVAAEMVATLVLLILAAAFEELIFRGYAFQTLLRGAPSVVPILLFSIYFGWAHWDNPNRTLFSTVNTALAGVWLSIAYLRTRNLWFPTALHFTWNWTMGVFFGIPISGLQIARPLLVTSGDGPVWLTGGSYGSEGGAAATVVLIAAIAVIWRARWLRVSSEMNAALLERAPNREAAINLGLGRVHRRED